MKKIKAGHQQKILHSLFIVQGNIDDYILANRLATDKRFADAMQLVKQAQTLLSEAYLAVDNISF